MATKTREELVNELHFNMTERTLHTKQKLLSNVDGIVDASGGTSEGAKQFKDNLITGPLLEHILMLVNEQIKKFLLQSDLTDDELEALLTFRKSTLGDRWFKVHKECIESTMPISDTFGIAVHTTVVNKQLLAMIQVVTKVLYDFNMPLCVDAIAEAVMSNGDILARSLVYGQHAQPIIVSSTNVNKQQKEEQKPTNQAHKAEIMVYRCKELCQPLTKKQAAEL